MRKISANYIFPVSSKPIKNGILYVDDRGKIIDIIDTKGDLKEISGLEFYNGALVPGFINAHCHLELSGLKGQFPKSLKLEGFLNEMINFRKDISYNENAIKNADFEMDKNGIVAVGDISNSAASFNTKIKSKIHYYTFIELLGIKPSVAREKIDEGLKLFNQLSDLYHHNKLNQKIVGSIIPHSPYSVSKMLFELIKSFYSGSEYIYSIHNQESEMENRLFKEKAGPIADLYFKMGISLEEFEATGRNSLESCLSFFPEYNSVLLVHNTFSGKEDIEKSILKNKNLTWVICPNSNIYIESRLPDLLLMVDNKLQIAIGTDSLASNDKLSILDEIKSIHQYYPSLDFTEILKWATLNGAKALKIDHQFGSFEKAKTPGVNLIQDFDFQNMKPSAKSNIKVLA